MAPLQKPNDQCRLGLLSLFILRTIRNTQMYSVGRTQSYSVLKQVVHMCFERLTEVHCKYVLLYGMRLSVRCWARQMTTNSRLDTTNCSDDACMYSLPQQPEECSFASWLCHELISSAHFFCSLFCTAAFHDSDTSKNSGKVCSRLASFRQFIKLSCFMFQRMRY
jgi:hypothetical protein